MEFLIASLGLQLVSVVMSVTDTNEIIVPPSCTEYAYVTNKEGVRIGFRCVDNDTKKETASKE